MYGNTGHAGTRTRVRAARARRAGRAARGYLGRAKGQALILVVIALLVLCLGFIVLFNTGQVVTRKVRLVNTADAAAYSAAVQQARALNLIAYMNRASVANEVAMAQMVSWYSWTNFALRATDNMEKQLQIIAIVTAWFGLGEAIETAVEALQEAKSVLEEGRNAEQQFFDVGATAIADLNGIYSKASLLIGTAGAADAANLARQIVKLNDPKASVTSLGIGILTKDALAADTYIRRYSIPAGNRANSADANRYQNVVMEARDPFSRQRDGEILWGWVKKQGGTDLVGYHSWVGLDTLDVNFDCPVFICGMEGFPPHLHHFDLPIAWGGGAGVDRVTQSFSSLARQDRGWNAPFQGNEPQYAQRGYYQAYSGAMGNGAASGIALSSPADGGTPWIKPMINLPGATVGLPDYDDVRAGKATVPYDNGKTAQANGLQAIDVGPVFTVLIARPMHAVPTSNNISGVGGPPDFQAPDQSIGDGLTAMSSAQVYFSRPRSLFPRLIDSQRELGNLFSPYWQARLMETPCPIRQAVAIANGSLLPTCK